MVTFDNSSQMTFLIPLRSVQSINVGCDFWACIISAYAFQFGWLQKVNPQI